ncbi:MAG TPA: type VI secretion system tube protein Hcp [Blastocatellia bacterium]|jgi:type VI secretion system secreted protein Hcp|nr:type VI secretion system tube protein Hcp [Blastocatellia bacterium]
MAENKDIFLKIEGITGESQDDKKKGQIEIESCSFGCSQSGSFAVGSGGGVGKVNFQDIYFTARVSIADPLLVNACASGKHIPKAEVTFRKAGGTQEEYAIITLTDVLVSSYQFGGSGGAGLPTCSFALNFSKFQIKVAPQEAKGNLSGAVNGGWDLKANKLV